MSVLFDMSVPIYIRGLEQLSHLLKLGEDWADQNKVSHEKLLTASLAPDMKVGQLDAL
jgi:hypothetical protein